MNPLSSRLVVFALALLLMASISSACRSSSTPTPETARITFEQIVNNVESEAGGGQASGFEPAQVGQSLQTGDAVKTLPESEARIDIVIGELRRISRTTANTVWRLGRFGVDRETIIELDDGKVFLFDDAAARGPSVSVVTPAGVASVRGTWLSVGHQAVSGLTEVQCFRGECELSNDQGTVLLTDEQKSTAALGSPPKEPEAMTEADRQRFQQLPEAQTGEVAIPTPVSRPTSTPTQSSTLTSTPSPSAQPAMWFDPTRPGDEAGTVPDGTGSDNQFLFRTVGESGLNLVEPVTEEGRTGVRFDGVGDFIVSSTQVQAPDQFTLSLWFKTTVGGGKLAGLESSQTGLGGSYDRQIYLSTDGRLIFGVWAGRSQVVATQEPVTDGQWHHVVATFVDGGQAGSLALYLDGGEVGILETAQPAQYEGWWRIGGGNLNRWTDDPGNPYFQGLLGSFRIYPTALTPEQIAQLSQE